MSETFNEASNDRIALSVQKTEKRDENTINQGGPDNPPYFAKITALAKDEGDEDIPKRAKGIQYYYDSDALDKQEAVDAWIFDDDSEELLRTGDIYSDTAMKVDQIVEVVRYNDRTIDGNQMQWLVRSSGGGAQRPYIHILSSTAPDTYAGDLLTSPTDNTVLEADIEIKALQVQFGTIELPLETFSDIVEGVYYVQPAVFN